MIQCPHCGNIDRDRFRIKEKMTYSMVSDTEKDRLISESLSLYCTKCRRTAARWSFAKKVWMFLASGSTDKKAKVKKNG